MKELVSYISHIEKCFEHLIKQYEMQTGTIGPNTVSLSYSKCIIRFSLERNLKDLYTILINPQTSESFSLLSVMQKKGLMGKKILDQAEINQGNALNDEISKTIFFDAIVIAKYCGDLVAGDYNSIMHPINNSSKV